MANRLAKESVHLRRNPNPLEPPLWGGVSLNTAPGLLPRPAPLAPPQFPLSVYWEGREDMVPRPSITPEELLQDPFSLHLPLRAPGTEMSHSLVL